jgi:MFS superfamily sulfate permease-like transporter
MIEKCWKVPRYCSIILLIIFYFTDFELVQYIPKCVFSSLLVLGAVDTFSIWFIAMYRKTQDLAKWLVVLIIAGSLFVGFLNAIFIDIALSMFVFVASFLRMGVVKFNSTGL